ncbi:pentapeptide repeat-containing protein [Lyngbya aestuarii]|uniref:pentapeptide repeat-containing protein n=1 Tax=Lyngbya aestuarii TaxID=118322 RepID=UPI00403DB9EF
MANQEHLKQLRRGTYYWNIWRERNPYIQPDLSGGDLSSIILCPESRCPAPNLCTKATANLSQANLRGSNFSNAQLAEVNFSKADLREVIFDEAQLPEANFSGADLSGSKFRGRCTGLWKANFSEAKLIGASFGEAILSEAKFNKANLTEAKLFRTDLMDADFSGANLSQAVLTGSYLKRTNFSEAILDSAKFISAQLVETNFEGADLTNCSIYGIAAWGLKLNEETKQRNLVITPRDEPTITVDDIEVAQFIYLLLNNKKIRNVIDTIAQRAVLILGRFTEERLVVLNAIRDKLRECNYLPILFDFDKPASRNITETVSTVAHLARFIIADLTDPQAIPQELQKIIPALPSVPVQPILQVSIDGNIEKPKNEWGMFWDFMQYCSVLDIYDYDSLEYLITSFKSDVIAPAEAKAIELSEKRLRIQEKKFRTRQKRERERNDS